MIIPWKELSKEALNNIIEQFVLREGTDYGEQEISFADKVARIHQLLAQNQVAIVYSELYDSIDIKPLPLKS